MAKPRLVDFILVATSMLLYGLMGYCLDRYQSSWLISTYIAVFVIYLYIALRTGIRQAKFWIFASLLFRLLLVFSIPNLSDDFYRYIWDGRLLAAGIHPFAEIPSYYLDGCDTIPGITRELFSKLNSPEYFTVYPPVAQFIFWCAVKISPTSIYGSVLFMKLVLFAAETGTIFVLWKLLRRLDLPREGVLLYALNPLIILELVGNLHFEAISICFLTLGFYFLSDKRYVAAGMGIAFSICSKLLPLIFLPALAFRLNWRRSLVLFAVIGLSSLLLFIPLWDQEIVWGFRDSLGYYFRKFEFNASVFYLVRAFGFWYYGYDIIQTVGWKLAVLSTVAILWISVAGTIRNRPDPAASIITVSVMSRALFVLVIYFLLTTTLHPWYLATLLVISVLTPFRFPLIWTFTIFLTYIGYNLDGFTENFGAVAVEYIATVGYLAYELIWTNKRTSLLYS